MELATKALATEDGQSAQTTQLQAISAAIGNIGLNNIGNLATLTTTDKTSLVGAVNEVNAGLVTKADKVASATNGNIASLDATGNLTDSGVKGDVSTTTLNSNPLSFTTDSEQAARECVITFEPIQAGSGDPSPSNVRAISGYDEVEVTATGKNMYIGSPYFDDYEHSDIWTKETEKYNGHDVWSYSQAWNGLCKGIYLKPGVYTFSAMVKAENEGTNINVFAKIASSTDKFDITPTSEYWTIGTTWGRRSFTFEVTHEGISYARIECRSNAKIYVSEYQLEVGDQATDYEPYNPITDYSESLLETVYGGTLNVETGELVVDRGIVDLGDLDWTYYGIAYDTQHLFYSDDLIDSVKYGAQYDADVYAVSNKLIVCSNDEGDTLPNNGLRIRSSDGRIYVNAVSYSDATAFKTAMSGVILVYELATPYTIHLTPAQVRLLQGNNVVTTNGTSIKLTYRNGELATLADVSSVAESVNAIGNIFDAAINIKNMFTVNDIYISGITARKIGPIVSLSVLTKNIAISNNTILIDFDTSKFVPYIHSAVPIFDYNSGKISNDCAAWLTVSNSVWNIRYYGETTDAHQKYFNLVFMVKSI